MSELPNRPAKVGQRWLWTLSHYRYVLEIKEITHTIRGEVVQKIDHLSSYDVGHFMSPSIETNIQWVLLEGQNSPEVS